MSISPSEIGDRITAYLKTEFFSDDPEVLKNQTALLSEGYIDSLSVMVLVEYLEKAFDFEFEPHEVEPENLDSIDKMVAFIQRKKR